jgi:Pyruvate/2-oxoacid:ferredoxin oxidoreductase gamma subunit
MAGVGGMGIGVVNAILVRAGHKEGYRVVFSRQERPGHPQRRRLLADHVREG